MIIKNNQSKIIILCTIIVALILRFTLIDFESGDYRIYLSNWYQYILDNGKFWALKDNFYNYNPPYIYLLVVSSYLFSWLPKIIAVKIPSIAFDFLGAFLVYKIVQLKYPHGNKSILAFAVVLFTPTVFINSAFWGQCDMIYTSGLLACIYFLCKGKEIPAIICFALSLSFKLQAIFLAPLLLILLLKKIIKWRWILLIPLTYLLTLTPCLLAGRSFKNLMLVYLNQANTYKHLTKNAPNIYQWIDDKYYSLVVPLGLILTTIITLFLAIKICKTKIIINPKFIVYISLLFTLLIPYLLPKMHERYFYPADVISIIFAFYFPERWYLSLIIIFSSLFSYTPFLLERRIISLHVLSIVLLILIIYLINQFNQLYLKNNADINN